LPDERGVGRGILLASLATAAGTLAFWTWIFPEGGRADPAFDIYVTALIAGGGAWVFDRAYRRYPTAVRPNIHVVEGVLFLVSLTTALLMLSFQPMRLAELQASGHRLRSDWSALIAD